jgi:hypothetical protein
MPSNPEPPSGKKFEEMVNQLNDVVREPRASAIIWHSGIEYLLDWVLRKYARKTKRLIERMFYEKVMVLEAFALLPETTVANLYAINQIRNLYAHEIEIETQEFDAKVRSIIERLKWYDEGSFFYQKYNTNQLFTTLASNTYHELHHVYYQT